MQNVSVFLLFGWREHEYIWARSWIIICHNKSYGRFLFNLFEFYFCLFFLFSFFFERFCWSIFQFETKSQNTANIDLFKVNNRNKGKRCEICSKFTTKTPEHISHLFLMFLLLTLKLHFQNGQISAFQEHMPV